jgi:hypothetical protein
MFNNFMLVAGAVQDLKLGFFGCISCEKSRFYAKQIRVFPILGGRPWLVYYKYPENRRKQ